MTDLVERLHDDVRQLKKMVEHAKLAGPETGVRVKDPSLLLADLSEAAARISQQDAELERLRREVEPVTGLWTFWNNKAVELAGKLTESRKTLEWMVERDDRNGSLPEAYRKKIDETLAGKAGEK